MADTITRTESKPLFVNLSQPMKKDLNILKTVREQHLSVIIREIIQSYLEKPKVRKEIESISSED